MEEFRIEKGGMFMTIKIRLTEEEEQMILSQEEADNLKVERDHIHITRALSKIIEESELDAESFYRLKEKYHFRQVRNGKIHIYRCSATFRLGQPLFVKHMSHVIST